MGLAVPGPQERRTNAVLFQSRHTPRPATACTCKRRRLRATSSGPPIRAIATFSRRTWKRFSSSGGRSRKRSPPRRPIGSRSVRRRYSPGNTTRPPGDNRGLDLHSPGGGAGDPGHAVVEAATAAPRLFRGTRRHDHDQPVGLRIHRPHRIPDRAVIALGIHTLERPGHARPGRMGRLDNFRQLLSYDQTFRQALWVTSLYALLAVPPARLERCWRRYCSIRSSRASRVSRHLVSAQRAGRRRHGDHVEMGAAPRARPVEHAARANARLVRRRAAALVREGRPHLGRAGFRADKPVGPSAAR